MLYPGLHIWGPQRVVHRELDFNNLLLRGGVMLSPDPVPEVLQECSLMGVDVMDMHLRCEGYALPSSLFRISQ